jgi:hypothetical protein
VDDNQGESLNHFVLFPMINSVFFNSSGGGKSNKPKSKKKKGTRIEIEYENEDEEEPERERVKNAALANMDFNF